MSISKKTAPMTIHVSDTVDSYKRAIHVNSRNGKVTMVNRWTDRVGDIAHTQRITLTEAQCAQLFAAIVMNFTESGGDESVFLAKVTEVCESIEAKLKK